MRGLFVGEARRDGANRVVGGALSLVQSAVEFVDELVRLDEFVNRICSHLAKRAFVGLRELILIIAELVATRLDDGGGGPGVDRIPRLDDCVCQLPRHDSHGQNARKHVFAIAWVLRDRKKGVQQAIVQDAFELGKAQIRPLNLIQIEM